MFKVGDKVRADDGYGSAETGTVKKITHSQYHGKVYYGVKVTTQRRLYWYFATHLLKLES